MGAQSGNDGTKGDLTRSLQRRLQLADRGPCTGQLSRELLDALAVLLLTVDEVSETGRVRHEKGDHQGQANSLQGCLLRVGRWVGGGLSSFGTTSATGTGASAKIGASATSGVSAAADA